MNTATSPKTSHCRCGHKRTPETIYRAPKTGYIGCRICILQRTKKYKQSDNYSFTEETHRSRFGGNRELAIERDGFACVRCGMTRREHKNRFGRDITVDHIDGFGRNTPRVDKHNNLDNLQTLCCVCHGKKDGGKWKEAL